MITISRLPMENLTPRKDGHYFFGYFDKFAFDESNRYHLAQRIDFTARQPQPGETAELGVINVEDTMRFTPFARSDAWCWQQGCMLQYLRGHPDCVIYNDRENGRFVSRIHNLADGARRTLSRPVYCVAPDGKCALSINFSRLDRERPGYGYPGADDFSRSADAPENDGIWLLDLERDCAELIVSVAEVRRRWHRDSMDGAANWFNHLLFNPSGSRFAFFHRWRVGKWHLTHMFTCDRDGGGLRALNLEDMSSHYTWIDDTRLINFSNRFADGWQYHRFTDRSDGVETIARDVFPGDGHCSTSPDGQWMLTDCYPERDAFRRLFLYNYADDRAFEIGCCYADPAYPVPTRCDLHPRWSRDGRWITFDSIHEGSRSIYRMDVTPITGA